MRGLAVMAVAAVVLPVATKLAGTPVHVVAFRPGLESVRVHRAVEGGEPFADFLARRPRVALNGTYYGADGRPLGILRSGGRWLFRGGRMATAFTINRAGRASLVSRDEVRRRPRQYPFAVAAGPRLLRDGRVCLNPEAEGFRPAARRVRASRAALGVRADGTALAIVDEANVTLAEFARVCREAGAVDAVNLDGGGATALFVDGKTLVSPRLPMANVITVGER